MTHRSKIDLKGLALDVHGRVLLSDDALDALDGSQPIGYAGGESAENNRGCTNSRGCGGTTNDRCTNTGCDGSTNYNQCLNKYAGEES